LTVTYQGVAFWIAIGAINIAFWSAMSPVFKAWAERLLAQGREPARIEGGP
jgi:hypothetical protein